MLKDHVEGNLKHLRVPKKSKQPFKLEKSFFSAVDTNKKRKRKPLTDRKMCKKYNIEPKRKGNFLFSNSFVFKLNKTPADQRDIFRPELFYNYISLRLKNKTMHYKNANKFEEKKTLIHRTPF